MAEVKACCKDPANLAERQERPDLKVRTCQVCGCRHRILLADPGLIGVKGTR